MPVMVSSKQPVLPLSAPSKRDQTRLRWITNYATTATDLVLDVIAGDERRMALDEEIKELDAKLADPALADHPLRAKALEHRATLERQAIDAVAGRGFRVREFARLVGELTKLIVELSPAGRMAAVGVVGPAATSIDPTSDLWLSLGFPAEPPTWCVGKQAANVYGWQNQGRKIR